MNTLTLYIRQEKILYAVGQEKGFVGIKDVESLLERKKAGVLNVIVSKPDLVFRKIEMPFAGIKKIRLVLPQELEETLPESPSKYYYHYEFGRASAGKRIVNVYAVKDGVYNYWRDIAKKQRVKLFFFSDTILFDSLIENNTAESNYMGIYAVEDYILINVADNGRLSGSYSCQFKESEKEKTKGVLETMLSSKKLPVLFFGHDNIKEELRLTAENIQEMKFFPGADKEYLFADIINNKPYKQKFLRFKKLAEKRKLPAYAASFILFLLLTSLLSALPYFKLSEKERHRDEIISGMESKFQETCPDVTKIVDPLVQIKEKIAEKKNKIDAVAGYPSVLKAMADVTSLFPEDVEVEIEQLTLAANNLTILGRIKTLKDLEAVKARSEAAREFSTVNIGAISFDDKSRVNFNITMEISGNE